MDFIRSTTIGERIAFLLLAVFAAINFLPAYHQIALYVCIPGAFILSLFCKKHAQPPRQFKFIWLMYAWIVFSVLTSVDMSLSVAHVKMLVACIMMLLSIVNLSSNKNLIPYLFFIWIVAYLSALVYVHTNLLDASFDFTRQRMDDETFNANTLSYYTIYVTFILFLFSCIAESEKVRKFLALCFLAMIPLSFYVAIITASRQLLLIQVLNFSSLIYLKYLRGKLTISKTIAFAAIIVGIIFFISKVSDVFLDSYLFQRAQNGVEEDVRTQLLKDAFNIGLQHPFTGVGPGCFILFSQSNNFSHCTYTELFANSGFLAMLFYVLLVLSFVRIQWKRYRGSKDIVFMAYFIFGLVYILQNMFYVYYSHLWLFGFYILVYLHSESYFKRNYTYEN